MRIFVSSTSQDLREHRVAAIRVLRQLGHEVIAMEDLVAGASAPLTKVLEMVDRSEAYVGLFAWRYGYVPKRAAKGSGDAPSATMAEEALARTVPGAVYGETSITHFEYLRAQQRKLPVLAFLLDERFPMEPALIDGFDRTGPDAHADNHCIRTLRAELQTARVVSWFSTPSDLEARVAAAVTSVGLSRQIDVKPAAALGGGAGDQSVLDSGGMSIAYAIAAASSSSRERVVKIDLADPWWSTRLFLIAALAEQLTEIRRILVVRRAADRPPTPSGFVPAAFVGLLSTSSVLRHLGTMTPAFGRFQEWLARQPRDVGDDLQATTMAYLHGWARAFSTRVDSHEAERKVKNDVSPDRLHRWFGDALLRQAVEVGDLRRISVVDLLRLLDYPNDFVPVLCNRVPELDEPTGEIEVIDKGALNARLARSYLNELKERARIV